MTKEEYEQLKAITKLCKDMLAELRLQQQAEEAELASLKAEKAQLEKVVHSLKLHGPGSSGIVS